MICGWFLGSKFGFVNLFAAHRRLLYRRQGIDKSSPPPLRQTGTWLYFVNINQTPALTVVVKPYQYLVFSKCSLRA